MRTVSSSRIPRAKNNFQFLRWLQHFLTGDALSLIIAGILLLMPALALNSADWPIEMRITLPILGISLIFGYFLANSRYDEVYSLLLSTVYGMVTVLIVAAIMQSANIVYGMELVLARLLEWIYDAFTGGINQDNVAFTLVVSLLFWFFGYNATWHIFRFDRVWRVILPPSLIMVVNMVIYAGDANLDLYLLTYVFMSLLLIVRSNLDAREWDWYTNGVQVPQRLRKQFIGVGAAISIIALGSAWVIPSGNLQERLDNFQNFLAAEPLRELAEFWNRLVEPIDSQGPATTDYYGGDSLNLGGAIRLGDQVIMLVQAPLENRYYWRSRVFERYESGRWQPSATRRVPDLSPPLTIIDPSDSGGRQLVDQLFTMSSASRLIYAAPQPLEVSLPGRIDLFRIGGDQDNPNSPMNVSVIRPERVVSRGESYLVRSSMSIASAFDLRTAGTNYPEWVVNPSAYAGGISPRVFALARQIVTDANATNPYDQAKAIERWLRTNIDYNEAIPSPPVGVDPVEWFLFDQQEGYCTYYATAMITMLRTLGIPARMAAGFAQGDYDASVGQFVVRERDAHTWVEVYFPGFGWVEFEPTSAQAPINREGDEQQQQPDTSGISPTNVPSETPTPEASPTALPSPTPDDSQQNPPQDAPTITPTPSPTPTVTPVIVPTVAPPVQPPAPPQTDFLSYLLPAIGIAFAVVLSVIVFVLIALGIYWWWEWRGMGGLSPVSRAYARLTRYIGLIGLRGEDSKTPEERRQAIVSQLPQAERPVSAITRAYTHERYSANPEQSDQGQRATQVADDAWVDARSNILKRWLKRFIPFLKD